MEIKSSLVANVWKIQVSVGDKIEPGDVLIILESMKMEIPVETPLAGEVKQILCREGDEIEEDSILAIVE